MSEGEKQAGASVGGRESSYDELLLSQSAQGKAWFAANDLWTRPLTGSGIELSLPAVSLVSDEANSKRQGEVDFWAAGQLAETMPTPMLPPDIKLINAVREVAREIPDKDHVGELTAQTRELLGKSLSQATRDVYLNEDPTQLDQGVRKFMVKFNDAIKTTGLALRFLEKDQSSGDSHFLLQEAGIKPPGRNALAIAVVAHKSEQLPHDSDALQKKIDQCVKGEIESGNPKPCLSIDLQEGVRDGNALFKDAKGVAHFLLMPTDHIVGVESKRLLEKTAPNYFDEAFQARGAVARALNKNSIARENVAVAVNSLSARTQNQLHLHLNCLDPHVSETLKKYSGQIGRSWQPLAVPLAGHQYMAMRVDGENLGKVNPFRLVADGLSGAKANMENYTVVVAGAQFAGGKPGFVVLADKVEPGKNDYASGVQLQDDACQLEKQ